jgi:predicted nucleotidyltransferase
VKKLEDLLKKYKQIDDIIIFGSAVKGKEKPNDIDIAVIVHEKDFDLFKKLNDELEQKDTHVEMIKSSSLLKSRLSLNLLMEGYSIEKKEFLSEILGLNPVKLFIYNLKGFDKSKKSLFSMALTKTIKKIKGKRIAPGAVIIPVHKSGYFNEFLESWNIKYKTSEWTMF